MATITERLQESWPQVAIGSAVALAIGYALGSAIGTSSGTSKERAAALLREKQARRQGIVDSRRAVDAALNMGEAGDLLLVFADALVRSWKQITKFKPASAVTSASPDAAGQVGRGPGEGLAPMPNSSPQPTPAAAAEGAERPSAFNLDGLIRDERGIRYAPETED